MDKFFKKTKSKQDLTTHDKDSLTPPLTPQQEEGVSTSQLGSNTVAFAEDGEERKFQMASKSLETIPNTARPRGGGGGEAISSAHRSATPFSMMRRHSEKRLSLNSLSNLLLSSSTPSSSPSNAHQPSSLPEDSVLPTRSPDEPFEEPIADKRNRFPSSGSLLSFRKGKKTGSMIRLGNVDHRKEKEDKKSSAQDENFLVNRIFQKPLNRYCADCSRDLRNAGILSISTSLRVVICEKCSHFHSQLSETSSIITINLYDNSKEVRSTEILRTISDIDNIKSKDMWEGNFNSSMRVPDTTSTDAELENWIHSKYDLKLFTPLKEGFGIIKKGSKNKRFYLFLTPKYLNLYKINLKDSDRSNIDPSEEPTDFVDLYTCTARSTMLKEEVLEIVTPSRNMFINVGPEVFLWVHSIKGAASRLILQRMSEMGERNVETSIQNLNKITSTESNSTLMNNGLLSASVANLLNESSKLPPAEYSPRSFADSPRASRETPPNGEASNKKEGTEHNKDESKPKESSETEEKSTSTPRTPREPVPVGDPVMDEKGSVRAGTIVRLVEMLAHDSYLDTEYMVAFLLTYRSFTTPEELLQLLISRYNVEPPEDWEDDKKELFTSKNQKQIRLRVFNVIKHWLTSHFQDWEPNEALLSQLSDFIEPLVAAGNKGPAEQIKRIISKKAKNITESTPQYPAPILPKNFASTSGSISATLGKAAGGHSISLKDIDPLELARQISILEQGYYRAVQPRECLNQRWNSPKKHELAPNIIAMIQRFNNFSRWVTTQIVKQTKMKDRKKLIEKFILLAQKCRELNNFNTVMEILAGLADSAVHRMHKTWEEVNGSLVQSYKDLQELMATQSNFRNFRTALHTTNPPCIPYFGVYLTDLTFIEDGNPDNILGGLINFSKCKKLSVVIREIQQYQQVMYNLEQVAPLKGVLSELSGLPPGECYKLSLFVEPREKKP